MGIRSADLEDMFCGFPNYQDVGKDRKQPYAV